jgi:hypothetical protein
MSQLFLLWLLSATTLGLTVDRGTYYGTGADETGRHVKVDLSVQVGVFI